MRIEDEIKQRQFKDEYNKLLVNLMFTNSWFSAQLSRWLRPYSISAQQYNILRILKGQYPKPAPLKLLTDRMIDKMSNTSRLVEKLKQKGMVSREICETNRRQVDIAITDKGLQTTEEITEIINSNVSDMRYLSDMEANQLNELLDKLRGK